MGKEGNVVLSLKGGRGAGRLRGRGRVGLARPWNAQQQQQCEGRSHPGMNGVDDVERGAAAYEFVIAFDGSVVYPEHRIMAVYLRPVIIIRRGQLQPVREGSGQEGKTKAVYECV